MIISPVDSRYLDDPLKVVEVDSDSHAEARVIFDMLLLSFHVTSAVWEIEVSFTDGVLTCGLAQFSWACFDVLCFLMRGLERSKCLFGKDS